MRFSKKVIPSHPCSVSTSLPHLHLVCLPLLRCYIRRWVPPLPLCKGGYALADWLNNPLSRLLDQQQRKDEWITSDHNIILGFTLETSGRQWRRCNVSRGDHERLRYNVRTALQVPAALPAEQATTTDPSPEHEPWRGHQEASSEASGDARRNKSPLRSKPTCSRLATSSRGPKPRKTAFSGTTSTSRNSTCTFHST